MRRLTLIFSLLFLLAACGEAAPTPVVEPAPLGAESGGMSMTPVPTATPAPVATPTPVVWSAGTKLRGGAAIRLLAEPAADASPLSEYPGATVFTILEPDGDFNAYPVEIDGAQWYRVRAADGLAGWLPAAAVTGE